MTDGGARPRIVIRWREAAPGMFRAGHRSVLVRRRQAAAECHDSGPAEESGQTAPVRSGRLKSCGCDAMTGAGGSFSGWSSESTERNGLGRSASGRCAPLGKKDRNRYPGPEPKTRQPNSVPTRGPHRVSFRMSPALLSAVLSVTSRIAWHIRRACRGCISISSHKACLSALRIHTLGVDCVRKMAGQSILHIVCVCINRIGTAQSSSQ